MTEVAFIRAINVGGRSMLSMRNLQKIFAAAGCRNVRTFINSGNVIFDAPADRRVALAKVRAALAGALGAQPGIAFRTLRAIAALADHPPFNGIEAGPRVKLYVAFLARPPRRVPKLPVRSAIEAVEAIGYHKGNVFVISRPKRKGFFGFPNAIVEEAFGVPATSRNWSTVTRIAEVARRQMERGLQARQGRST